MLGNIFILSGNCDMLYLHLYKVFPNKTLIFTGLIFGSTEEKKLYMNIYPKSLRYFLTYLIQDQVMDFHSISEKTIGISTSVMGSRKLNLCMW